MPCYYPLTAWRSRELETPGRVRMVFTKELGLPNTETKLPCGQCIGCRLDRARSWAVRCLHEKHYYDDDKCHFLTLTYDDAHLPPNGSLYPEHFTKFMKRLRKRFGNGIRYFQCGEYGESFLRPHHHAIIFNMDLSDRTLLSTGTEYNLYHSAAIESIWSHGFVAIGNVTFDSVCYTARYILKKVTGDSSNEHYGDLHPEYVTMSRRPGIGRRFYDEFKTDLYNHDKCVVSDRLTLRPPRYYDSLFGMEEPEKMEYLKQRRRAEASRIEHLQERLEVRDKIAKIKQQKVKRKLETNYLT